jgi:hypothetical protein
MAPYRKYFSISIALPNQDSQNAIMPIRIVKSVAAANIPPSLFGSQVNFITSYRMGYQNLIRILPAFSKEYGCGANSLDISTLPQSSSVLSRPLPSWRHSSASGAFFRKERRRTLDFSSSLKGHIRNDDEIAQKNIVMKKCRIIAVDARWCAP